MVLKKAFLFAAQSGGYYSYRQIINNRYMMNYNLPLQDTHVSDLKKYGKTVVGVDKVVVQCSPFQKFMDKDKKTIIIQGDGLSGVAQLAYLHSQNKYNVMLVTPDHELSYDDELLPPYLTVLDYPKFDTDVNYSRFGINGFLPWFTNGLYTYLKGEQFDENLNRKLEENYDIFKSLSERYSVNIEKHVVQPSITDIRNDVSISDEQVRYFGCLNAKKWVNNMEVSLNFEPENPIIMKSTPIARTIFLEDTTQFVGVMCSNGVVQADYLIVASENNIFEKTKFLGTRLPIVNTNIYMSTREGKDFRFGDHNLAVGKLFFDSKKPSEDTKFKKRSLDITPDCRPMICRNPYSENVFFNFGYGAWQNGLAFYGASKIEELIENPECPEEILYSSKRFIPI